MRPVLFLAQILSEAGVPSPLSLVLSAALVSLLMLISLAMLVLFLVYWERKQLGRMQNRVGPNWTGPWGLLQTLADALKLLVKEDLIPAGADPLVFRWAPVVTFLGTGAVLAAIPLAEGWSLTDLDVGLLYLGSFASLTVTGFFMAGWGSQNKFALLGGMRAVAQLISYELPLLLSLVGVVMWTGSLRLEEVVAAQRQGWFLWRQPLGALLYFSAALAEINRTPFDLPEGESELVAGFHTEYSGMRWALFFLAEYASIFLVAAITTTLFLGGWLGPWLPPWLWFLVKTGGVIFVIFWLRAAWLRLRIDQVMTWGWKVLLPLAVINILLTAGEIYFLQG